MNETNVLELRGITKRFPGVLANDRVDFELAPGEVHALLGENGAGKSTLMNVLYGLYGPDEGEIYVRGERVEIKSPNDAIELGVGMVHQHFMLIPVMTVAENLVLSVEPHKGPFLDLRTAEKNVREISERYSLAVDPTARIDSISVAQQQRAEILKALYRGAKILILDEPTAVLTPQEAEELGEIIRALKAEGESIIFITHKLHEVLDVADRITVLRQGKRIDTIERAGATEQGLARMMVGRDVVLHIDKGLSTPGEPLLEVEDLRVIDDRELAAVRGVSFQARAGEIVGIAGVDGNGQTELIDALTGLRKVESGTVRVKGQDLTHESAITMLHSGIGHIPEDRQARGLVLDFTIAENLALHDFRDPPLSRNGWLFPNRMLEGADELIAEFDVRGGNALTPAGSLSGGNQQKVVAAREVTRDPDVLIAAQPTRGLDVGAIEFVHRRLVQERDEGRAVVLLSFELEEILSLSDRILVIFEGEIVAEYLPGVTEAELGVAMTGGAREESSTSDALGDGEPGTGEDGAGT